MYYLEGVTADSACIQVLHQGHTQRCCSDMRAMPTVAVGAHVGVQLGACQEHLEDLQALVGKIHLRSFEPEKNEKT